MRFLDYLFHGKELKAIGNYFKMLNGYSPTFTSFSGGVYEMDLTRTAVNNFATHCSKLKPEIEGSALKTLEKTLQHKPNYFMDTTKFIKRLATYVAVEHTAFIIPIEDEYGRLCGWYPLRAERCEVIECEGQLYLRYLFANGSYGAIEFERVGIMTDFEYKDDLFGEDNSTLAPTMQLIHTQNEGIINAVKNSANIRFLAKVANMLKPEDIKKERKNNTFAPKRHKTKIIQENSCKKTRKIVKPQYMYEQMAHHSVMRVFVPIAMRGMYYHVYGSIPGKGVHRGKRTVERWIREDSRNCKYIYKLDIRHFFESVPHRRLKKALKRKIRDRELLKKLFIIIDSHKPGLPLGYYPSQWFGNFYLQPLDHFIMEQLHVKHYIRYMDDMVIFGNNKKELHKARLQIEKFITEELGLQIKKNWQVFRFDYVDRKGKRRGRPLDFMGFKFYRDRTTIRKSILQGIRGKVNRVKRKEKITWVDAGSLLSRLGWIWHSDTYAYYERYIKPYVKVKVLKTLVSKHARKENIRNGMVRSRKHRRRKTERAGYNKQPAPCI